MSLDFPNLSLLTETYIWVELRASKAVKHVKTLIFQDRMSSLIQKKTSERDCEHIYLFLPLENNKYVIIKLLCGENEPWLNKMNASKRFILKTNSSFSASLPAVSVKLDDLQSFSLLVKTLSLKETRSYRLSRF